MKKGILLFDIDRTIFDTDKMSASLSEKLSDILGKQNIAEIDRIKRDYIGSLKRDREFTPDEFCQRLAKRFGRLDVNSLLEVFYGKKSGLIYRGCVYPEFFEIFEKLRGKFRLGVYSEGTLKFQKHKFESMKISKYLEKDLVFIVPIKDNAETLAKIPKEAVIVDDKETVCEALARDGFHPIWLNKKDDRENKMFDTIHSLLELPDKLM